MKSSYFRFILPALIALLLAVVLFRLPTSTTAADPNANLTPPKNIILFIGDGMGFEQVKAASYYAQGTNGMLAFQSMPFRGEVRTHPGHLGLAVTDSAAAGTALATGRKVYNSVISQEIPGDGHDLETLLEYYQKRCKATGLATTTYITHATPAAFGAHEAQRSRYNGILHDYLTQTKPNLLLGGARVMTPAAAEAAGYTVVTSRDELLALELANISYLSGQFNDASSPTRNMPYEYDERDAYAHLPHLSEMTTASLEMLSHDPDGFFLMVEGGRIDHAGHLNRFERNVFETLEFARSVRVALEWASGRDDTLIVVTADHETGGLRVLESNGQGEFPAHEWTTTQHTADNVPLHAFGPHAELFSGTLDNTDVGNLLRMGSIAPPFDCDVTLHQSASSTAVAPGAPVTITLAIENQSELTAADVTVQHSAPLSLTTVGVTASLPITPAATASQWQIADLAPRSGGVITLTAVVADTAPLSQTLAHTASISATIGMSQTAASNTLSLVVNHPPQARGEHFATAVGQPLTVTNSVLSNDLDPDGQSLTAELAALPAHGAIDFNPDGTFSYTPHPGYIGRDRFAYWAVDTLGGRHLAEVEIQIATQLESTAAPKNIILLVGDGMGREQVRAGAFYAHGASGTLSFEKMPYQAVMTTHPALGPITDSAAAATAMATGRKVYNGVISQQIPGDGSELETLLEFFQQRCKQTGLVTTTFLTHATPAAFAAHEPVRSNYSEIADDYLTQTRPNVLLGGRYALSPTLASAAGYTVVANQAEMQTLTPQPNLRAMGLFDGTPYGTFDLPYEFDQQEGYATLPHLSEMTATALDLLSAHPDGFFLLVESGRIDHAAHVGHFERTVFETLEFANAAAVVIDWAEGRDDTLIIVTADHETGGLAITHNGGQGNFSSHIFTTNQHTDARVPVYAQGVNAHLVYGPLDNTDIYHIIAAGSPPSPESCDLTLSKSVQRSHIGPGQPITYTLSLHNGGVLTTTAVSLTDRLPAAVISPTVSATHPLTNTAVSPHFAWQVADLAPRQSAVITVTGFLSDSVDIGTPITNTATLTATLGPTQTVRSDAAVFLVNSVPTAVDDVYTATIGVPLSVAAPGVLNNDSDVDEGGLTPALGLPPAYGTVTFNADGSFTYEVTSFLEDRDFFTYVVEDVWGGTAVGTVFIEFDLGKNYLPAIFNAELHN